jgi:amidase
MAGKLVGRTAGEIAEAVRTGTATPADAVREHLEQIDSLNGRVGAFLRVRHDAAAAEAEAVGSRPDLGTLPLAGVPVAIKDNIQVEGEPTRYGCPQTSEDPAPADHEVVQRLRQAGAVVVGITRLPELGVWGTTEDAWGVARNPWKLDVTPGGSSGGSAAAVASAMVPVAHGNDGLGSIRIPSACCGLFGIKPGVGVVPSRVGLTSWRGLAENGPLATTVDDAALMLSVMAGNPALSNVEPPASRLRVAVSTKVPLPGVRVDPEILRGIDRTAKALLDAGHEVARADPPYTQSAANAIVAWFTASTADETKGLDERLLEPRQRRHAQIGRRLEGLGRVREKDRDRWKQRAGEFFSKFDVLVTPVMTKQPLAAEGWPARSWWANFWGNARWAPFPSAWNFAQYPGASVPAGMHSNGTPLAVQLVAPNGGEGLLLSVAKQLEQVRPWPRHAPLAGVD